MEDRPQPIKMRFYDVIMQYGLDYVDMQKIAEKAGVKEDIIEKMFISVVVRRGDALKILAALSEYTIQTYTLDNVRVALSPTFNEIHTTHNFDLSNLAMHAGVPYAIVDMMLSGHAVPIKEARLVLQMASRLSGQNYTLDTVDMATEEEAGNG